VIDPTTHREQLRRIGQYATKGLDRDPRQLRFVTWTLKYNRCHWLEILALEKHYERAEIRAQVNASDVLEISHASNITRLAIHRPISKVRVEIAVPPHLANDVLAFSKPDQTWQCDGPRNQITLTGKRPGLQGPIDDAFATPFLCVRGTGQPWNKEINDWAVASLQRFEYEWARYMRGNLPVKDDSEVTQADVRDKHLVVFGDPGSNSWIAKALPNLPITWTQDELRLGDQTRSSKDHAPALICASPFDADRYLVVNSGHTFHEKELAAFNYLLFPRLGDWAVMKILPGAIQWQPTTSNFPEQVAQAGYFDEAWLAPSLKSLRYKPSPPLEKN
jgi:hypothetical protein